MQLAGLWIALILHVVLVWEVHFECHFVIPIMVSLRKQGCFHSSFKSIHLSFIHSFSQLKEIQLAESKLLSMYWLEPRVEISVPISQA